MAARWQIRLQADPLGYASFYLLAALGDLAHAGEAEVTTQARRLPDEGGHWIEVVDRDTHTRAAVCIDPWDGPSLSPRRRADIADVVWKRTYRADALTELPATVAAKVRPFGLWMSCRSGHEPPSMLRLGAFVRRGLARHDKVGLVMIRNGRGLARVFAGKESADGLPPPYRHYEAPPRPSQPKVLLQARLWDPAGSGASEDRRQVNEMRAALVRRLRDGLGDRFTGGLVPSPYVEAHYPDCVTPHSVDAAGYQQMVLDHDIVISTTGLHGSVPFSVAELLSSSRVLVTQRLRAEADPALREGIEMVSFDDPDGALAACEALLDDAARRHSMMHAAHEYATHHVRPGAALKRHLEALAAS